MQKLFDDNQNYQPSDPLILELLGSTEKQGQMRHHKRGPAYYLLGRKVIYRGFDLNSWAEKQRVDSSHTLKAVS